MPLIINVRMVTIKAMNLPRIIRIHFLALHGCRYGEAVALLDADIYDGLVHIS